MSENTKHMKNTYRYIIALVVAAFATTASAQRGTLAFQNKNDEPMTVATTESNVKGASTINSNLKSRGFVGPYEIVAHRERGFFGPSTVETYVFDTRTGTLAVINPSSSPGVGIACVNGGALVGASYLFGHSLRPDQTSVSNGSNSAADSSANSAATGGTSSSNATGGNSNANGGAGGIGNGGNATGGNGNGGAGGAGGSGHVPPGLINNPGHGPK
jgi:hypothetical protein